MKCKSVYCSRQLNNNKNILYRKLLAHVKSRRNPSTRVLLEPIPITSLYIPLGLTPCSLTVLHPRHSSTGTLHVNLETWTHYDSFFCLIPHFPGGTNLETGGQTLIIRTVETTQEDEMFALYFLFKAYW